MEMNIIIPSLGEAKNLPRLSTSFTVDELYSEVLYQIVHLAGSDLAEDAETREELFGFLQELFEVDADKHADLLTRAKAKKTPKIVLNAEVIDAKDLKFKLNNGVRYCTIYLSSGELHQIKTTKSDTASPIWEERFAFPADNVFKDTFRIEVWDTAHKGAKRSSELLMRLKKDKLIGLAQLDLKDITVSGKEYLLALKKPSELPRNDRGMIHRAWKKLNKPRKARGEVRVKLSLSVQKNPRAAQQEHQRLLRELLKREVEETQGYQWRGKFQTPGQTVLDHHAEQCGLSASDTALAHWVEYTDVHVNHPLSFTAFPPVLKTLVRSKRDDLNCDEEVRLFWEGARKLLPSCLEAVRNIDKTTIPQLTALLSVLALMESLNIPKGTNLRLPSPYGWLSTAIPEDGTANCDIRALLEDAVTQRAQNWLVQAQNGMRVDDSSKEAQLSRLVSFAQLAASDIQHASEVYDTVFQEYFNLQYSKILFLVYQDSVSQLVEPVVTDVCNWLEPLQFSDSPDESVIDLDSLTMGTKLFEVYLLMQRLAYQGSKMCTTDATGQLRLADFHKWFERGVGQWLDVELIEVQRLVTKAVNIDQLCVVDDIAKHSASAVDTLAIFNKITDFWKTLDWPDVKVSHPFVAKIIDDICRCSVHYVETLTEKVERMDNNETGGQTDFYVTNKWCVAIHNADFLLQNIGPFIEGLRIRDDPAVQGSIYNAEDKVRKKMENLMEIVACKIEPAVKRFLLEGAELAANQNDHHNGLLKYFDDNLRLLHKEIDTENYKRIAEIVWKHFVRVMNDVIDSNLEANSSFFSYLYDAISIALTFFRGIDVPVARVGDVGRALDATLHRLELLSAKTADLVHAYHLERVNEQRKLTAAPLGQVTVRVAFLDGVLCVQVMNARKIKPIDANVSCDPYVKIRLLPEKEFKNVVQPKTRVHPNDCFPLFDETFTIPLSSKQQNLKDALIVFSVKDHDFLRKEFIAEAYLPFSDIPRHNGTFKLEQLEQVHLNLSRPARSDSEACSALENRKGDKLAAIFLTNLEEKEQSRRSKLKRMCAAMCCCCQKKQNSQAGIKCSFWPF